MAKKKINTTIDSNTLATVSIFPTQILNYLWKDVEILNDELIEVIFEKEHTTESMTLSNAGGFHSSCDLFAWDYPCVETLRQMVNSLIMHMAGLSGLKDGYEIDISISSWVNIVRNGHYHIPHNHPNNFWSGVYYVDAGIPDETIENNGLFEFCDPRTGSDMITVKSMSPVRYQVKANPGLMMMFPSFVTHYVHPFIGKGERISIAFNISIIPRKENK